MVAAITAIHYALELPGEQRAFLHLHHLLPALYVFPIIYASLKFQREGGLRTGLLCIALVVPNVLLWHQAELEWLVGVGQIGAAMAVRIVLSNSVAHEAWHRKRAEEMATAVAHVNRRATRIQESERRQGKFENFHVAPFRFRHPCIRCY